MEVCPLDLELPGHFAAPPVWLAAVPHQEFQGGFVRQEWVVLPQVTEAEVRVADHLAAVQFLFAEQNAQ